MLNTQVHAHVMWQNTSLRIHGQRTFCFNTNLKSRVPKTPSQAMEEERRKGACFRTNCVSCADGRLASLILAHFHVSMKMCPEHS